MLPTSLSIESAVTYLVIGLCVGFGWAIGAWLAGLLTRPRAPRA